MIPGRTLLYPFGDIEQPKFKPAYRNRTNTLITKVLGYFAASLLLFALAKSALLLRLGAPLYSLPFIEAYRGDMLMAAVVAMLAVFSAAAARGLIIFGALLYSLNLPYSEMTGTLIDRTALTFSGRLGPIAGSAAAMLTLSSIALAVVMIGGAIVLSSDLITEKLGRTLRSSYPAAAALLFLAAIALLPARVGAENWAGFRPSPIAALLIVSPTEAPITAPDHPTADLFSSPFGQPSYAAAPLPTGSAKGMNVLLLVIESLSSISLEQGRVEAMPRASQLAREGLNWSHFYATTVLTIKSLFAINTGFYPTADFTWITRVRPRIPLKMLPQHFKHSGYRTAFITSEYQDFTMDFEFLSDRGFDLLLDGSELYGGKQEGFRWAVDDRLAAQRAIDWIGSGSNPFFLTLFLAATHHPYKLPGGIEPAFTGSGAISEYLSCAKYIDDRIGEILDSLRARGLLEQTIVVLVGDHGEAFGQHANSSHSADVYEESVRVPFYIYNPKLFPQPAVIDRPGSLVDIMPTLVDLTELASEPDTDGRSLFARDPQSRLIFFSSHLGKNRYGLVDGPFKYIESISRSKDTQSELFDLQRDPDERSPLTDAAERTMIYSAKLAGYRSHSLAVQSATEPSAENAAVRLTELPIVFMAQDWGTPAFDRSLSGAAFKVAGTSYPTFGIGTHANSILVFDVSRYRGYFLEARVGRDSGAGPSPASAHAEIWFEGGVALRTPNLSSDDPPYPIRIQITGDRLSLVINRNDSHLNAANHFDWIEPRLVPPEAARPSP